jgi:hypothetical protein
MSTARAPPTPPPHLFRTIKRLQDGVFLCLPRNVTGATDSSLALARAIEEAGESKLEKEGVDVLPHLRIVRMSAAPAALKRELDVLEALESDVLAKAQVTGVPESSWLCMYPVFGPTLETFGAKYKDKGGIPSWFLAHILLSLVEQVSHMHAAGFALRTLTADTVMLDPYPRDTEAYRYRSYPAVHFTNLGSATDLNDAGEEQDVNAVLELMQRCVVEWSNIAPATDDDPMILILHDIRSVLAFSPLPPLDDLVARLTDVRHDGPTSYIPPTLRSLLHADLVTKEELADATVVLKFVAKHEEFVRIVADEETLMGGAGFTGMRTKRIMVVRFAKRKEDFAGFVGRMTGTNEGAVFRHGAGLGRVGGLEERMDVDAEGEPDDMDIDAEGESE